ncbi:hypothetical protein Hesp01_45300 [Herbidospora sp. NBRC 101105]|nr:hypothetical protein Hesp01_45300 [Herbidospora sp. NBRC 101105]
MAPDNAAASLGSYDMDPHPLSSTPIIANESSLTQAKRDVPKQCRVVEP